MTDCRQRRDKLSTVCTSYRQFVNVVLTDLQQVADMLLTDFEQVLNTPETLLSAEFYTSQCRENSHYFTRKKPIFKPLKNLKKAKQNSYISLENVRIRGHFVRQFRIKF